MYTYNGYLKALLKAPRPEQLEKLPSVTITGEDMNAWRTIDVDTASEWRGIPVRKTRTEEGVQISGRFEDVLRIDTLSPKDPRYWVPISSLGSRNGKFPVDLTKYPIAEVTYRCTSDNSHPTWMWVYEGGSHFGALPHTKEWCTVARLTSYFGFPKQIDALVLRLYSPTRTTESIEFKSVRFRAMTPDEAKVLRDEQGRLETVGSPKRYEILDEVMPIGVYADAEVCERLADMLGISVSEYWSLAMEDLVRHHHNVVALSRVDLLSPKEWRNLQDMAVEHGIKFVARHSFSANATMKEHREAVESHIAPFPDSPAILAHGFSGEPFEDKLGDVLEIKSMIEAADPKRPVSIISRYPNAYPLFAPFFAASGVGHFATRSPWYLGDVVRTHLKLGNAQQFWVAAPAFTYTTEAPEWSTGPEMRLMANLAFANGARGWLAYTYHNDPVWIRGRCQRSLTGSFLTFSDLWSLLGQRMGPYGALAPLFLGAHPAPWPDWIKVEGRAHAKSQLPSHILPTGQYHLEGDGYSLYIILSNDTRDMTTAQIRVDERAMNGREAYVLSDYLVDRGKRSWDPMPSETAIEMFPGQAHIILIAEPERCLEARTQVGRRMVDDQRRSMRYDLQLAAQHGLEYRAIEDMINSIDGEIGTAELLRIDEASDALMNLLYEAPVIHKAKSKIISVCSAICATDGALCRLMGRGKTDDARGLGEPVVPIAAKLAQFRIRLRDGEGAALAGEADVLLKESLELLARVRGTLT